MQTSNYIVVSEPIANGVVFHDEPSFAVQSNVESSVVSDVEPYYAGEEELSFNDTVTKISHMLFAFWLLIAGAYMPELSGCQVKRFMQNNMLAKHFMGVLTVYFVIVLIDQSTQKNSIVVNIGWTLILYTWFLLTTRTPLYIMGVLLFICVVIHVLTLRLKQYEEQNRQDLVQITHKYIKYLGYAICLLTIIGFALYAREKHIEYGNKFSWISFIVGNTDCSGNSK